MQQGTIKVGFSRVCINARLGAPMQGYYYSRKAKGILDDLYATGVAFDNGQQKVVMITTDLIHIKSAFSQVYREKISKELGLPIESIFLSGNHIHTGPLFGESPSTGDKGYPVYQEYLGYLLCDCAKMALDDVKEAKLSYAVGEAKNISFIRRYYMKDGSVKTNPGIGNPNIVRPVSDPHEGVYLLKAERENADDVYIVSFGTHADVIGGEYLSADWPGFVRSTLERTLYNVKCAFFTGFEGDVNHVDVSPIKGDWDIRGGYEFAKHMGHTVAGAVLQICGKTKPVEGNEIAFGFKTITVPSNQENDKLEEARAIYAEYKRRADDKLDVGYQVPKGSIVRSVPEAVRILGLENGPESYDFLMSAIRIGNVAFGGVPGEPFTEIGNRIRANSKYAMTVLCCCVNGGNTYYPTSEAYDQGGYEPEVSNLKKGADNIIVAGLSDLLNSL